MLTAQIHLENGMDKVIAKIARIYIAEIANTRGITVKFAMKGMVCNNTNTKIDITTTNANLVLYKIASCVTEILIIAIHVKKVMASETVTLIIV